MGITYKSSEEVQGMRVAGRLAAEVLDYLTPHIKPGITTREIDRLAAECMKRQGTTSATLGYQPAVTFEDGLAELAGWLAGAEAVDRVDEARAELAIRGLTV